MPIKTSTLGALLGAHPGGALLSLRINGRDLLITAVALDEVEVEVDLRPPGEPGFNERAKSTLIMDGRAAPPSFDTPPWQEKP